jgi:hypothetical protein
MPIPEAAWRGYIDVYQLTVAAFYGSVASIEETCGLHRIHGDNMWAFGLQSIGVAQLERYVVPIFLRASLTREWAEKEGHAVGEHVAFQYPGEIARMMTLKRMAPDHRLFKDLSVGWFARRGIRAVLDDPHPPSPANRLVWAGWFLLMTLLPRRAAVTLAEWTFIGRRRPATRPLSPQRA